MAETEVQPGFDRRSLIKKGLVGAGIAATAPVISTFNTAAFAQTLDGIFGAQYQGIVVNAPGQITSGTPVQLAANNTVGACITEVPLHNGAPVMPTADISEALNGTTSVTFTVTGDCVFIDAASDFGNGNPQCLSNAQFTAFGTNTITWTPGPGARTYRLRLVIDCG